MIPVKLAPVQLGTAMAVRGKPPIPQRPNMHRGMKPPTAGYRKGHPTLKSPAIPSALPGRATQTGVNQTQLEAYLKALQRG